MIGKNSNSEVGKPGMLVRGVTQNGRSGRLSGGRRNDEAYEDEITDMSRQGYILAVYSPSLGRAQTSDRIRFRSPSLAA
jgi:hypothetical protein